MRRGICDLQVLSVPARHERSRGMFLEKGATLRDTVPVPGVIFGKD